MTSDEETPSREKGEARQRQHGSEFSQSTGQGKQTRNDHDCDHQNSDRELGAVKMHGQGLIGWMCLPVR